MMQPPSHGLQLAFYGDDFTGSTATLEALAFAGLPSILFFDVPDKELLDRTRDYQAIGIAGLSRSKSPAWMEEHLPRVFRTLRESEAPLVHYKVCSTFDSAPHVGSIGKAIEIGAPIFANDWTPVLTAVPDIGRWQAFGTLFAASSGKIYRIDRHPVMMHHPVTPMGEADLRLHLAQQTALGVGLIDIADLKAGTVDRKVAAERAEGAQILLIDAIDEGTMAEAGKVIWEGRRQRPFVVGSQGVEYALLSHWRKEGLVPSQVLLNRPSRVERIAVVSGSCSPVTAEQIADAERHGFETIALKTRLAVDPRQWEVEKLRCLGLALSALEQGRNPLVYSARGPSDPEVQALEEAIRQSGANKEQVSLSIGEGLGRIMDAIVQRAGIRRAVISGGDSSGQACLAMGLTGMRALAPLAKGAPLCSAISGKTYLDGLEIVLKGGQMGQADFFTQVLCRQITGPF